MRPISAGVTEPGSSKTRLAELDALRGIAALAVLLFHYTVQAPKILPGVETIGASAHLGEYGVQLFFAISGFVIFMTLEHTRNSADFAFARFTRLFPAYWAAVLLTSAMVWLLGADPLVQPGAVIATNLTMLQDFVHVPSVDGVYWSLAVELAFYLCMWTLWRIGALGKIEAILCAWIALRFVWLLAPALPWIGSKLLLLDFISFFAIGITAYRVRAGARRWRDQAPVLACAFAGVAMIDGRELALVFAFCLAVFVALVAGRLDFLNRRLLLWLGALSYPLYLVHQNIGYAAISSIEGLGAPPWLAFVASIVLALGLAQLVHDRVEIPSLRILRNLWKAGRFSTATAPAARRD